MRAEQADLIVFGEKILPGPDAEILSGYGVAVSGERITAVAPIDELRRKYSGTAELGLERGLLMPGLINMHTHAPMSCYRGLADDLPLMRWLEEYIFPAEAKLTPEVVYWGAKLSIVEMIKSGTTSFCDMYLFSREVARATADAGMRGWIGEVVYDFPSPCYGPPEEGLKLVREMAEEWHDNPLINITVEPHAVYTCSPDLLRATRDLAVELDLPWIIHLAENHEEMAVVNERYGKTPVGHLDALGLLDERCVAAHCVMLSAAEIELMARKQVNVAHCPESNMKLASGVADVGEMIAAGVNVSLGTDGSASNNDLDMFSEMTSATLLQKVNSLDPTVLPARVTLAMATENPALALGMAGRLGVIAPGAMADMIVIDLNAPHLTPMYDVASHLVYAVRGADVVHSVIGGKVVMRDRAITTIDEEEVLARVNGFARDIAALF